MENRKLTVLSGGLMLASIVFLLLSNQSRADEVCVASWYGPGLQGGPMSNGKRFDMHDQTIVASRDYANGTKLLVTNISNGKSIVVTVQDYGPKAATGRCLDMAKAGAVALDFLEEGTAKVAITPLNS